MLQIEHLKPYLTTRRVACIFRKNNMSNVHSFPVGLLHFQSSYLGLHIYDTTNFKPMVTWYKPPLSLKKDLTVMMLQWLQNIFLPLIYDRDQWFGCLIHICFLIHCINKISNQIQFICLQWYHIQRVSESKYFPRPTHMDGDCGYSMQSFLLTLIIMNHLTLF